MKTKQNYNTLTVLFEESKTVYFASSIMKKKCVFPSLSRLPVKLICCLAFGPASWFCCRLKSNAISL